MDAVGREDGFSDLRIFFVPSASVRRTAHGSAIRIERKVTLSDQQLFVTFVLQRTKREIEAVANLNCPYIPKIFDSGGMRAAAFYTLIGPAELNGLDPSFYLRTVLARIADLLP
jgi:hypothetical protein